jgi:hypothetical protein
MTHPDRVSSVSFKSFLFLVAGFFSVAAVWLIILSASASTEIGETPASAVSLVAGANQGVLGPGEQRWFEFTPAPGQASQVEQFVTLIFTPDDGNRARNVSLQLFDAGQVFDFSQGRAGRLEHFGAGRVVSRDSHPETGELFWTGWLFGQERYYIQLVNGNEVTIDYWLFPDNVSSYDLGEPDPLVETEPADPAQGAAPQTALPLIIGLNKGGLDPGQETWYSFRAADLDQEHFEEMALTMITTPDNGNRLQYMTFQVYTAGEVEHGSAGGDAQINNMGAGSIVYRDHNSLTGERFWSGWVIDNELYYVRIRNGADVHMNYWLFTGDVYGPELQEAAELVSPVDAAPGTTPGASLDLAVGLNRDRLNPGEARWYRLSRSDGADRGHSVETIFTLKFTPVDGNWIRDVNFELFEDHQVKDWAPDNRFNLINFGQGTIVNRDNDPTTGELLWAGHVLSGNIYYMRVSNETEEVIDYWLYPEDVINANLD